MKTSSVRIKESQVKAIQEIAATVPGFSLNGVVQRAVDIWLEVEGPVYKEAFEEAKSKLRQPVVMMPKH